jgi:predicted lysophospholipase L1 biosynthesis ABC-type transport system permease subunit
LKRFGFYLKYAGRSVRRSKQLSFFAVLCVAVGVGTLVALQLLTASVRQTLTGDIQARAGGDLVASVNFSNYYQSTLAPRATALFDQLQKEGQLQGWAGRNSHAVQITGYFNVPPYVFIVDPARFPLYGKVDMVQPAGGDFQKLLAQPNSIIVSKSLWETNDYKLGDEIEVSSLIDFSRVGDRSATLKIVGVIDPALPGVQFDPGLFTGFGIVSQPTARQFLTTAETIPTTYYLKTAPSANPQAIIQQLKDFNEKQASYFPFFSQIRTAREIVGESSQNLEPVEEVLSYIGLIAILIGGLGCINTMLVVVGRRTTEIATIKALGLKSRQTMTIITLEVLILGAIGSLFGIIIGVGLSLFIKGMVEGLFSRPLEWALYPGPILTGFLVGTVASAMFGFLPAYAAAKVRPAIVLRQQSQLLPQIGGLNTLAIIGLMTVALGGLAGVVLGKLMLGVTIAFITLLVSALLVTLMYVVVLGAGQLPAPAWWPSFKMALRNFNRHRTRTATTLLVVTVSLFFISFIGIISDSIKTTLTETFDFNLGFNAGAVNVFSRKDEQLKATLEREVPGLQKVFISNAVGTTIYTINGKPLDVAPALKDPACGPFIEQPSKDEFRLKDSIQLSGRSLANGESISPNGPQKVLAGRNFTPADMTRPVLLVSQEEARCYGIKVGDKINMALRSNNIAGKGSYSYQTELEVIGIVSRGTAGTSFEQGFVAPFGIVNDNGADFSIFFMQIDPAQMKTALTKVQGYLYGNFVFDFTNLINVFTRLLNQVLSFPLLLSLLTLISGSILIANNVALAVLERRSEVGVLKAIGAKRKRVLAILLWENALLGLLGGLIGISTSLGVASLIPALITSISKQRYANLLIVWSPLNAGLLMLLGVGLAVAATLLSSWRAVQEKPLVVLRND